MSPGYAQSAPVDASLLLFDASKGTFLDSYTPPPAVVSPTTTTLPGPTPTSHSPSGTGNSGSPGTPGSSPTETGSPGDDGDGNDGGPQNKSGDSKATAVALGVVFGVLGLVAGGAAAYYMSRRRASNDSFHLLGPSDDDDSPHLGPVIPVAGAASAREKGVPVVQNVKQKLAGLVPGMAARQQQPLRRDMLADEDTRVFEPSWYDVRREGSIGSWSSGGRARPTLGDMVQGSLTSLRNVGGAMLAYAAGNRRKEASGTSSTTYWDKEPYQYSDKAALVKLPSLNRTASRPKGGREASYASQWSYYEDPFADYDVESFKMPGEEDYDPDAVELKGAPSLDDPPPRPYMYSRVAPATMDITRLSPLSEKPSFQTMSDPTTSSDSSHASPLHAPSSDASRSSSDVPRSPRLPSSIIDANPPIMTNMRRSDSWWSRFTKTPLLDRTRSTDSGRALKPLDFRDPNPPPRLVPIKESSNSLSPDSPTKRHNRDDTLYASVHHGRSATSLQTSKTADSAEIEQMGRTMDIVQKGTSIGSRRTTASTDSGTSYEREQDRDGEPPSSAPRPGPLSVFIPADAQGASSAAEGLVLSPTAMTPRTPGGPRPPPARGGSVAARIEAFEQHSRSPPPPPPSRPKKGRTSVYGLAPKPSLFVANPDRRTSSGDS